MIVVGSLLLGVIIYSSVLGKGLKLGYTGAIVTLAIVPVLYSVTSSWECTVGLSLATFLFLSL
jgi:hypothetical protein